jgi:glycosyltransferase involved in cell wall biosynthesis
MAERIRVLDIITTAQGGKRLLEYRVSVINRDPLFFNCLACPEEPFFTGGFSGKGIPFEPFPMSRGLNPLTVMGEIYRFLKLLGRIAPDIVHAHTSKAGAIARLGCALYRVFGKRRVYLCYQVHSFYFNALTGFRRSVFLGLERALSRISDVLLFQNALELEQARAYGMDRRALLINIGNGIDLAEFSGRRVRTLPPWTGGERPLVLICVARVEAKKNHALLIAAASALREKIRSRFGEALADSAFTVLCVGEIGDPGIPRRAAEQGLGNIMRFTGVKNRAELEKLLDGSDISVLSSSAEGKPRALMEAMNLGIPCVATDVCGTREVIDHGRTGLLVPPEDAGSFAEALLKLMQDAELYAAFSRNSMEKAKNEFDENTVIERLKTLYREKPRKS